MENEQFRTIINMLNHKDRNNKLKTIGLNLDSWNLTLQQIEFINYKYVGMSYNIDETTPKHICHTCGLLLTDEQVKFGSHTRFGDKSYYKSYAKPYCDECIKGVVFGSDDGFMFRIYQLEEDNEE